MSVRQWWLGHSKPGRFDLYTRWSLYVIMLIEPFVSVALVGRVAPGRMNLLGIYGLVSLLHALLCIAVLRAGFGYFVSGQPVNKLLLVTLVVVTAAMIALAAVTFDWFVVEDIGGKLWGTLAPTVFAICAICPLTSTRQLTYLGLAVVVAFVGTAAIDGAGPFRSIAVAISVGSVTVGAIAATRVSLAMVGLVWEIDRARGTGARLAVAEERLRFSRDLHDVVGRNLAAISVKGQLAAELAHRGRPEAYDEMQEVRRIADDSLREVREVVRGYRKSDVATEVAGAQAILRAAGIDCTIDVETSDLQEHDALGWVVREAVTNVLRHSSATSCTIRLRRTDPSEASLVVWNNGVAVRSAGDGHGLTGLAERLASIGGRLEATRPAGDEFMLTARVPFALSTGQVAR